MQITVNGQHIAIVDDTLVSNSVNIYECEFEFDSSWDGFAKTSVWQLNSDDPIEVVIDSGVAVIPHEVLENAGILRIGVYGTKDEKVMPTVWLEKRKVCLGTPTGSIGTEPTPSIYAQILAVATEAKDIAEDVQTEWESVSANATTLPEGSSATASFDDGVFSFGIPQGERGTDGTDGVGIESILKTSTSGLVDTYTITYTNGTTSTFTVTNGAKGDTGNGISSITKTGTSGLVDTYTITFTNGATTTFTVTNGEKGDTGATGNGIASIEKTATVGKVDTYTITYTDGTTTTFEVTNGEVTEAQFNPVKAELENIRVGADGTTYSTAGDAVRTQIGDISEVTNNLFTGVFSAFANTEAINGKVKNTATDSRTFFNAITRYRNGTTIILNPSISIYYAGRYSITATPETSGDNILIGHNGSTKMLTATIPFNFVAGTTYTISFKVESCDPTVVGGLVFTDIQIEQGETMTDYSPHIVATDDIARHRAIMNSADIANLQNTAPIYLAVTTTPISGKNWLRYSDGALFSTSSSIFVHTIKNDGYTKVVAELYAKDIASAAIAFFSTDTISTDGYIKSASLQCIVGQNTYYADVPEGCKLIAFTYRTDYESGVNGKFEVSLLVKEILPQVVEQTEVIPTLEKEQEYIFTDDILPTLPFVHNYIRYSDGASIGSGNYMFAYKLKNTGFRTVRANLYVTDTIPAAIAFYSTDEVSTDGYMKSDSIQSKAGWGYYEADVPDGCKLIVFTTRNDSAAEESYVKVAGSDYVMAAYANAESAINTVAVAGNNANIGLISTLKPCYDHLFVNKTSDAVVIPHESLYHVRLSAKMGYKMIEANVAPTSDGVYIVNHLTNGKFGGYFHHIDGTTDISDIALNTVTWEWVETNVRYNSQIPKYRTRPCRLEEFLAECRQQNIIPFLGRANDSNVVAMADKYMGKGNYVAYGATRTTCPNAIIYHWVSNLTSVDDILAYCKNIGKPFIYGMGNTSAFTDTELKNIIGTLHQHGYWIGTSYVDNNWSKYAGMGMDFNGTQTLINRIENGNLHNIDSMFGFDGFTFDNATESNGVLTFSAAGNIYPDIENTEYPVCGIDVEIWFNGGISFYAIGELGSTIGYTSDGSSPVFLSIPIINGSPRWHIVAASGCEVYDIKFKASVF